MKNKFFILFLLIFFFLNAQNVIHSSDEIKCSVNGILCDGFTRMPLSNSYVFALSADKKEILGYTKSGNIKQTNGLKAGRWKIDNLKPVGDILIVGFFSETKFNLAIERTFIGYNNKDIGYIYTNPPIPIDNPETGFATGNSPLQILSLAGWIAQEISTANSRNEAIILADKLLNYVGYNSQSYSESNFNSDDYFPLSVGYKWTYLVHDGNSGIYNGNYEQTVEITDRFSEIIIHNNQLKHCEVFSFISNPATSFIESFYSWKDSNCFVKLNNGIYWGNFYNNVLLLGSCIISSVIPIYIDNQQCKIESLKLNATLRIDVQKNKKYYTVFSPELNEEGLKFSVEQDFPCPVGSNVTFSKNVGIIEICNWCCDGNTIYTLYKKNF